MAKSNENYIKNYLTQNQCKVFLFSFSFSAKINNVKVILYVIYLICFVFVVIFILIWFFHSVKDILYMCINLLFILTCCILAVFFFLDHKRYRYFLIEKVFFIIINLVFHLGKLEFWHTQSVYSSNVECDVENTEKGKYSVTNKLSPVKSCIFECCTLIKIID